MPFAGTRHLRHDLLGLVRLVRVDRDQMRPQESHLPTRRLALHQAIRAARPGLAYRDRRRELYRRIPDLLWHGEIDATLAALAALRPSMLSANPAEPVSRLEETINSLATQQAWLGNYAAWREAGYPVGSGLVERAVFVVINRRMKRQGMRWRRAGRDARVRAALGHLAGMRFLEARPASPCIEACTHDRGGASRRPQR